MIKHFRKDGTQVDSIEGIVLKKDDFKGLYQMLERMEKEKALKESDKSA